MEEVKYVKWPVKIDHIEVRETEYTRNEQNVEGKTYLFFVNPAFDFGFDRPSIMTVFSGSSLAGKYEDLETSEIDGATVITAKTILAALAPGETEVKPYKGDDGYEFKSYGEYLLTLGTSQAFEPKMKTPGIVFAEMPIGNGIEEFIRMKNGKPQKRQKTGQTIISTHVAVASMLMYTPAGWMGKFGNDQKCLEAEVHQQISAGLWQKIHTVTVDNVEEEAEPVEAEVLEGEV